MKPYLITTGSLFAILTLLHAWNFAWEWNGSRLALFLTAATGAVTAALSVWAWLLLARLKWRAASLR